MGPIKYAKSCDAVLSNKEVSNNKVRNVIFIAIYYTFANMQTERNNLTSAVQPQKLMNINNFKIITLFPIISRYRRIW